MKSARWAGFLLAAGVALLVPVHAALAGSAVALPDHAEAEDALPEGGSMTGRAIFDRFLENRLHSAVQYQTVLSRDPGGNEQRSRFWVRWKDYRDNQDHPGERWDRFAVVLGANDPDQCDYASGDECTERKSGRYLRCRLEDVLTKIGASCRK